MTGIRRRRFNTTQRRVITSLGLGLLLLAVGLARVLGGCPGIGVEPLPTGERFAITFDQIDVVDGDTIRVDGRLIRLLGADTPEKSAPHFIGNQEPHAGLATGFTIAQLRDAGTIEVHLLTSRDRYNRLLGHVYVDGESLSLRLIRAGHAYETVSRYGANGFPEVAAAIQAAADEGPEPVFQNPSDWRRENRASGH